MPRSVTWPLVASDLRPVEHSLDARPHGSTAKVAIPGTTGEGPCPNGSDLSFLVSEGTKKKKTEVCFMSVMLLLGLSEFNHALSEFYPISEEIGKKK